jgi:hypothetical protein
MRKLRTLILPALLLSPAGTAAILWYAAVEAPPPGIAGGGRLYEWGTRSEEEDRFAPHRVTRNEVAETNRILQQQHLGHAVGSLPVQALVEVHGTRGVLPIGVFTEGFFASPLVLSEPLISIRDEEPFVIVSDSLWSVMSDAGATKIVINRVSLPVRGSARKSFRGIEAALNQHVWIPDRFAASIDTTLSSTLDALRYPSLSGALLLNGDVAVADILQLLPGQQFGPVVGAPITGLGRVTAMAMQDSAPLLLTGVATLLIAAISTLLLSGASETSAASRASALRLALGATTRNILAEEVERYALFAPVLVGISVVCAWGGALAVTASLGIGSLLSWKVAVVGVLIQCVLVVLLAGARLTVTFFAFRSIDLYHAMARRSAFRAMHSLAGGHGFVLLLQGALSTSALLLVLPTIASEGGDVVRDLVRRWPADLAVITVTPAPGSPDRRLRDVLTAARSVIGRTAIVRSAGATTWLPGVAGGVRMPVFHRRGGTLDSAQVQVVVTDSVGASLLGLSPLTNRFGGESGPLFLNAAARNILQLPPCGEASSVQIGSAQSTVRSVAESCLSLSRLPGAQENEPLLLAGAPSDFDGIQNALLLVKLERGFDLVDLDSLTVAAGLVDVGSPVAVTEVTRRAQQNRLTLATLLMVCGVSAVAMLMSTARATGELMTYTQRSSLAVRFAVGAPVQALFWEVLRKPLQPVLVGAAVGSVLVVLVGTGRVTPAVVVFAAAAVLLVVTIFVIGALPHLLRLQRYEHTSVLQQDH